MRFGNKQGRTDSDFKAVSYFCDVFDLFLGKQFMKNYVNVFANIVITI